MSEPSSLTFGQALGLNGALFAVVISLLTYIWRRMERRVDQLTEKMQTGEFAEFKAKDTAREQGWWEWRREVDHDRNGNDERLRKHTEDIARILGRLNGMHK